jgi:hypothetical protein
LVGRAYGRIGVTENELAKTFFRRAPRKSRVVVGPA